MRRITIPIDLVRSRGSHARSRTGPRVGRGRVPRNAAVVSMSISYCEKINVWDRYSYEINSGEGVFENVPLVFCAARGGADAQQHNVRTARRDHQPREATSRLQPQ